MGQNVVSCVAEIGEPLSRQATTQRSIWRRCPWVMVAWAVKVWPLTVALVTRAEAFGSVRIDTDSALNSRRMEAEACASHLTAR